MTRSSSTGPQYVVVRSQKSQKLLEVEKDPRRSSAVHRRHALHITVVLSKAAHSGPSVCLRARAPCPLRVSCPGADRAFVRFRAPLVQDTRHVALYYKSFPGSSRRLMLKWVLQV